VRREAVVDANAIVYYVVEDSPMHVEAEALLDGLDVWNMPTVVIHELVWFFKKAAPDEGVGVLKAPLEYEKAVIHCEDAATLRGAVDAGLTHYNDAVVILTAKKLGDIPRHLQRMDGKEGESIRRLSLETPRSLTAAAHLRQSA